MRKLLILFVVLGVASMANATLQISVNGDQDPTDSEYTVLPSENATLDIWTDAAIAAFENVTWALIVNDLDATIDGGVGLVAGFNVIGDIEAQGWAPAGYDGRFGGYLGPMTGGPIAGDTVYDEFLFHCINGENDAVIELWDLVDIGGGAWALNSLLDSAVIHQVPEPMTMVLLGLGGLMLRRRK